MVSWTWKKTPHGYEGLHGRAKLEKRGKKWFLNLDGKDHEIHSRKPSFDHAEGIIERELGPRARHASSPHAAYDYDRTRTISGGA